MPYDFDSVKNRRGTGSLKWSMVEKEDLRSAYPFSMADMEWGTAPAIRKACADFALNGFYTYTAPDEKYLDAVCAFMKRRHGWAVAPDWITCTYGIVSAIHTCVRAYTKKGEGVIVQQPVYAHFMGAVELNDRKVVNNALIINNGRYEINFDELEKMCADENNKMLILCSPHNPVGRVWNKEELEKLADICVKHNIIVVSDEIHFDIVSKPHTVFATVSEEAAKRTVTCTAPSKSYNIAGLGTSNIIISDEELRAVFRDRLNKDGYECINCFGYPAIIAAYNECDEWLDEMNKQVHENFLFMKKYIAENLPQITLAELEGTYLAWLDVSFLGVPDGEIADTLGRESGVFPNAGGWFGKEGEGFIRLNIAVPRTELAKGLESLKNYVELKFA